MWIVSILYRLQGRWWTGRVDDIEEDDEDDNYELRACNKEKVIMMNMTVEKNIVMKWQDKINDDDEDTEENEEDTSSECVIHSLM